MSQLVTLFLFCFSFESKLKIGEPRKSASTQCRSDHTGLKKNKNKHTGRECSRGDLREYVRRLKAGSLAFSGNQPRP